MKDKTMKKSGIVGGAFITTLGIVITKIIGVLYVIPFHAIIGEDGGALYGYAYTIYLLFMSLSSLGIPLAISKLVSEYQTLGYYNVKKRAFVLAKKISLVLGIICFVILILFAPLIAKMILGDLTGGNNISDVVYVIRIISIAILVVPILSIYRGYFEGHRLFSPPSISQVIEQLFRVIVIVLGSFLALKVFKQSLTTAVGVAVFGAFVGAFASYFYLMVKLRKNKRKFNERVRSVNEPIITDKEIIRKIFIYAAPFIMIDIFRSLYNYVDMVTVVKGLVKHANYSVLDSEAIMSMLSTWANKFNMVLSAIASGLVVSLIPNLTKDLVANKKEEVNKKITQSLSLLLFFTIPMSIGISFLAKPIWELFYGASTYGPSVLSYYIFTGLIICLFTCVISILQVFKDYKIVFSSLLCGFILKIILNISLINSFYKMGVPAYYGVITASILGYLVSIIICLVTLYYKYHISFEELIKNLIEMICGVVLMLMGLLIIKFIVPISSSVRIVNILIIVLYGIIGAAIYFFYAYKTKLFKKVFNKSLSSIINKLINK